MGVFLHLLFTSVVLSHGQVLPCLDGRFQIFHLWIRNFYISPLKFSAIQFTKLEKGNANSQGLKYLNSRLYM